MILSVSESVIKQLREKVNELSVVNYELKPLSDGSAVIGQDISAEEASALVAEYNANLGYISGMLDTLKFLGIQLLRKPDNNDI